MLINVEDLRRRIREPVQVWNRPSDNLMITVVNYGSPRSDQEHKLRLIIYLEKAGKYSSIRRTVSWVDCTYLGVGDILDLNNWSCNSKHDDMRLMLMEVGISNLLKGKS